jgi:hypothetical protein
MKIKGLNVEHLQRSAMKSPEVRENKLVALLSVRQRVRNLLNKS